MLPHLLVLSACGSINMFREVTLFEPGDKGSRYYRIPAITTAKDGSLFAVIDRRWDHNGDLPARIDVVGKRSTDHGLTWSDQINVSGKEVRSKGDGDASIVTDRKTGKIVVIFNGENGFHQSTPDNPLRLYYTTSSDNGLTWAEKREFTQYIYSKMCTHCDTFIPARKNVWKGMFLTAGIALETREGRIMVASVLKNGVDGGYENRAVYTDDMGETWNISANAAIVGGDESKFFQINDDRVVISIRQNAPRYFAYSNDQGEHWANLTKMNDLWDPWCNGDVIRYTSVIDGFDKNRILHTIPYRPPGGGRSNVSVLISYDEGQTWPIKKVICPGGSAYSAITIDHNGDIHVFYEKDTGKDGYSNVVASFSLDWATDGKDHYELPSNLNWCICDKNECDGRCPTESYKATTKVFDQYVESYFLYPSNMKYTVLSSVRDFYINLSAPGLLNYKFKNQNAKKPKITLIGQSDHHNYLELENVQLESTVDQLFQNDFSLTNSNFKTTGSISRIEVGRTKIRLAIDQKLKTIRFSDIAIQGTEITIQTAANDKITVLNGISGVSGEESASVPIKIIPAEKTQVTIAGKWSSEEKEKLTIDKSGSSDVDINYDENIGGGDSNIGGGDSGIVKSSTTFPTAAIIIIIVGIVIVSVTVLGTIIYLKKHRELSDVSTNIHFLG